MSPGEPKAPGVGMIVPIRRVLKCLRKIELDKDVSMNAVRAYRDAFAAGYGYYYYNNDPLDSDPLKNPFGWEIYNGSSGGQVNYKKEFNKLIYKIKRKGSDGTLAYTISDIIIQARDAHSSHVSWEMGNLILVQVSSDQPVWLNLRKNKASSEVQVVGNVVGSDGKGVAETKVVRKINGRDPLKFLKDLSSNTAMGASSQFRSPGVRMNVFLGAQRTDQDIWRWTSLNGAGDISTLPSKVKIKYEDGSSTTWAFAITVPEKLAFLPTSKLQDYLRKPAGGDSGPLALYLNMVQAKPVSKQQKIQSRTPRPRREEFTQRDYYIYPGVKDATNLLGFTVFKDSATNPPETFSGYTVLNDDTMVWKLPTFGNPTNVDDIVNFWNAMVMEAQEKKITKLIIDISNNGGGKIRNAYAAVALLYPDVPLDEEWSTGFRHESAM